MTKTNWPERDPTGGRTALVEAFERKVAGGLVVRIVVVQELERTARGKIPRLVRCDAKTEPRRSARGRGEEP